MNLREPDLLHGLSNAADRVKAVCSPDVSDEVDRTVSESLESWNKSQKSLRDLCERYTHALNLWTVYRKNSDVVNEWVDVQLHSLSNLPAEEVRHQVEVRIYAMYYNCEFTITSY